MIFRDKVNDIMWESCGGNKWGEQNLVLGKKCVFKFVFIQLERIIQYKNLKTNYVTFFLFFFFLVLEMVMIKET